MVDRADVTKAFAAFISRTEWAQLPERLRHEAKRSLLNFIATALAGCREDAVEMTLASLASFSGPQQATIIGRTERIDALSRTCAFCPRRASAYRWPRPAAGVCPRGRDRVPDRQCHLARALRARMAHHLDMRHARGGGGSRKAVIARRRSVSLGPRSRRHANGWPRRVPWHASEKPQRRECGAKRTVVGAARRTRL
jgi:hypothetical protein